MLRVLLVDDDDEFREQLRVLIEERYPDVRVVAEASSANAAVAEALVSRPDVVLIDLELPGPDGSHAATVISQAIPAARLAIVSGHDVDREAVSGLDVIRKDESLLDSLGAYFAS